MNQSPFPGIDPYLEDQGYWPDFHSTFIGACREAISRQLPGNYEARIDERVSLREVATGESERIVFPDVAVVRRSEAGGTRPSHGTEGAAIAVAEPVTVPLAFLEETRETYIRILHRPDRSLVGVVELLSPTNKAHKGYGDYVAKRDALLRQPIHLVELDFLAAGNRLPMAGPLPAGTYFALVARGDRRPDCDVYAWSVRHPLPAIRIPLRAPDPDLTLDLAAVVVVTHERGQYADSINYRARLTLPLPPEDRAWAEELAKASVPT